MKKIVLLSLVALALVSCKKGQTTNPQSVTTIKDTIPDKSAFNIAIVRDSVVYNESALKFAHTFHDAYVPSEDINFLGTPYVEFAFLSADGLLLNVDGVPYKPGMVVNTYVTANANGAYFIRAQKLYGIPKDMQIWIRDNLQKDSLELHTGNYHFSIDKTDTNTFGKRRFQIVVRPK